MAKKKKPEIEPEELQGELSVQDMLARNDQKYLLVNLLARRAQELKRGARAQVGIDGPHTTLELAIAEGAGGLLRVERKKKEIRVVNLVETQ